MATHIHQHKALAKSKSLPVSPKGNKVAVKAKKKTSLTHKENIVAIAKLGQKMFASKSSIPAQNSKENIDPLCYEAWRSAKACSSCSSTSSYASEDEDGPTRGRWQYNRSKRFKDHGSSSANSDDDCFDDTDSSYSRHYRLSEKRRNSRFSEKMSAYSPEKPSNKFSFFDSPVEHELSRDLSRENDVMQRFKEVSICDEIEDRWNFRLHKLGVVKSLCQLKLVLCGSDDKITITVLGLKSLPQHLCNTYPTNFITLKFAMFPDIEKLIRYKTTPVAMTSSSVDLHNSFTFAISRREIHKRLLISAWCKTEEKNKRTFIGCMSFGVRNLVNTQEITQGWYYFLSESYGRNRHLKAKINAPEFYCRHSTRNRRKMHAKFHESNCEQCDGFCFENSANENRSNNCELIEEEFVCYNDTTRYRRRMEKLNKRRRVSFNLALDFKQVEVPVDKQPSNTLVENAEEKSTLSAPVLKKPLCRTVQSSTQKSSKNSPIGHRNVHRKTYDSDDVDFFQMSPFKKQAEDVFVDVVRRDNAYDPAPVQLAPIFKVQSKVAKVVAQSRHQEKESRTGNKLVVRTLQKVCANSKSETTLPKGVTNENNAYDKLKTNIAPSKDASNGIEKCITTKSLSDNPDRGYHSDTGTSASSANSEQEMTDDKTIPSSNDKITSESFSKENCKGKKNKEVTQRRNNRLSTIFALVDTNQDLPEENKTFENASSEVDTKLDRTKKSRSSFKHWIRRKSLDERKSIKNSEEKENHQKSKRGSIKRSKRKEGSRASVDFTTTSTLLEVLQNEVGSTAFYNFLQSEYSEENLDFWKECEAFKSLKGTKLPKAAVKIYEYYVANGSPKEINIDAETRETVKSRMSKPTQAIFADAQVMIYKLMAADSFRRFLKSKFANGNTKVSE